MNQARFLPVLLVSLGLLAGCGGPMAHVNAIAANQEGAFEKAKAELAGADDATVESIAKALDDSDAYRRAAACQALGLTGNRKAAPHLVRALGDPMPFVRRHADRSLMGISGKDMKFMAIDPPDRRARAVAKWKAWSEAP